MTDATRAGCYEIPSLELARHFFPLELRRDPSQVHGEGARPVSAPQCLAAEGERGPGARRIHGDVAFLPFGYVACRRCRRVLNVDQFFTPDCVEVADGNAA